MLLLFRLEKVFQADLNRLILGACAEETVVAFGFDLIDLACIALRHAPFIREYSIGVGLEIFQDEALSNRFNRYCLGQVCWKQKDNPGQRGHGGENYQLSEDEFVYSQ